MYYQVKPEHDGQVRYTLTSKGYRKPVGEFIRNELYTERELSKYLHHKDWFNVVNLSKNDTYHFFGARFADVPGMGYNH